MTFDHTPIATVASNILAQFGRTVTVRNTVVSATNPVTGTVTASTTDTTANAYFDEVNQFRFPSTLVEAGDRVAYIDVEVDVGDKIIRDAEVWEVVSVTPYELGLGVAAWQAVIRR